MPDPSPAQQKAFDFAQEMVKQVLTVSAAIITVTITFIKDFAGTGTPAGAKVVLAVGWLFYLLAVVFGFGALGALAGSLGSDNPSVNASTVRRPAIGQMVCFILGLTLTIIAGVWAL